ncbi:unnamed protein product [Commensalibacter communis]|uniref:hypothetical protein n=1 Tax=Commensalibacter communis TaxID=2972786 RepID=UPI0022FF9743|nr:hypothetical protein [Commensalibacter communis]CAI3953759.1 unnamed protein product [Commensalibacter communis]CAI3959060.1 unnamed protein product [Commensalibacter communis]
MSVVFLSNGQSVIQLREVTINHIDSDNRKLTAICDQKKPFSDYPRYVYLHLSLGKEVFIRFEKKVIHNRQIIYESEQLCEQKPDKESVLLF